MTPSWVVITPSIGGKTTVLSAKCLRCGTTIDIMLPQSVDQLSKKVAVITERHKDCKEKP